MFVSELQYSREPRIRTAVTDMQVVVYHKMKTIYSYNKTHTAARARSAPLDPHFAPALGPVVIVGAPGVSSCPIPVTHAHTWSPWSFRKQDETTLRH